MSDIPTKSLQLVLTNDSTTGRITVEMEAFFDFSFWMAEELEDLVQRHRHQAAPRAMQIQRKQLRSQTK